ncbi:MAG: hypothetical protein A2057_09645 [Ignavibacteria bacterium GWA2_35_9]|nr:MAG: hypothetical protein A2057_09645 [Ignavibacteria bacterium GWA2_35_9]OGU53748.1 MAG: hypothetical protein A2080_05980 [Ignavibacteria bacterium GWC2_36_12]
MIDKQKIESLFKELDTYLKEVKQLSLLSEVEYLTNVRNIYSGRYLLQISIETCINIGNHIISREALGIPKDYSDTFRILQSNNIISTSLLERLILMTRFRNRIVHLYWDIDDKLVLEIIKNNYEDFINYRTEILEHLKKNQSKDL